MDALKTFLYKRNNQILVVVVVVAIVAAMVVFFKKETVDFFSTGLKSFSTDAKDYLLKHEGEAPEVEGNQEFGASYGEFEGTGEEIAVSSDLLPLVSSDITDNFNEDQVLVGSNYLSAGELTGINTTHSSLKNANLDIRAAPSIPRDDKVSPWSNSTIEEDNTGLVLA